MEYIFKVTTAIGGSLASYLWGGWSVMLQTLLIFVVLDYFTGVIAAGKEGELSSRRGFSGIKRKVVIFVIVAVAHMVDKALGDGHLFRDGTIAFYLANECLSIIENSGRIGLPVPDSLTNAIKVLRGDNKEQSEESEHDNSDHTKTDSKNIH